MKMLFMGKTDASGNAVEQGKTEKYLCKITDTWTAVRSFNALGFHFKCEVIEGPETGSHLVFRYPEAWGESGKLFDLLRVKPTTKQDLQQMSGVEDAVSHTRNQIIGKKVVVTASKRGNSGTFIKVIKD